MQMCKAPDRIFRHKVDYDVPLIEMISAGRYDLVGVIAPELFPLEGRGVVEFEARYFNRNLNISTEDALQEIEEERNTGLWLPARIENTLSHGATFPNEQRRLLIVGLGSIVTINNKNYAPVLQGNDAERGVALGWCDNDWPPNTHFLAIRRI